MTTSKRLFLMALVALAAAGALYLGRARVDSKEAPPPGGQGLQASPRPGAHSPGLPRLVDLGAGRCVACKAMTPILDKLRREFSGRMEVVFIDIWEDPEAGRAHKVGMIPTQIF